MNLSAATSLKHLLIQVIRGGALELAADEGLSHFRRCSQASKRGAMFDDCYHAAKTWIDKRDHKQPAPSKRRAKQASKQVSMF
ncbi:hypothetical protein HBA43_19370 [Providencia rettgeri]|uniref:hypothetical protein n=1 Tax=Providencia rettgeri TaxID=587 RepID=UPI001419E78E|nr:hypothetical protein [Providencia rettgeri]NIA76314.1 hypothetical protein [Providencia rettgeri]NIA80550.1 hypothetical protein [Providencia rettgeri]NIB03746.1 hypothetical protein [Providencia rettgeri]NIB07908.1 hypothetical protein [Providencia rettgeri]NIB21545.1 hypothetical protein [Providencia rettgeri]